MAHIFKALLILFLKFALDLNNCLPFSILVLSRIISCLEDYGGILPDHPILTLSYSAACRQEDRYKTQTSLLIFCIKGFTGFFLYLESITLLTVTHKLQYNLVLSGLQPHFLLLFFPTLPGDSVLFLVPFQLQDLL